MTNKNNSVKKARLGYLDLSFEGRDEANRGGLDNGRRPHGGYKGSKKYPPSPMTIDKCKQYHRKLREDIDKLYDAEFFEIHGSPQWSVDVSKEITHSGESPLFLHKLLSPSPTKVNSPYNQFQRLIHPLKCQKPVASDGVLYYRANRTHQFLTQTEVKDQTESEVNLKYGRPTRTTLLRARQRIASAPVNAYQMRREMVQRLEDIKSNCYTAKQTESFNVNVEEPIDGEPRHSFLTGARYNRAHCLDAKGLVNFGVYMPRNNPLDFFVTGAAKFKDGMESPGAPPDSPSCDSEDMASMLRQRPRTAPGYTLQSTPVVHKPRQAWNDKVGRKVDRSTSEEFLNWPKAFTTKGRRVHLKRTYSGPKFDESILPSVQGFSVTRKTKQRETVGDTSSVIQPPPSLHTVSSKDEMSIIKHIEIVEMKKENRTRKPKPILVDRSVNVPSVTSESSKWKDEPYIVVSAIGSQVKLSVPPQQSKQSDLSSKHSDGSPKQSEVSPKQSEVSPKQSIVCPKQSSNEFQNSLIETKEEVEAENLKDTDEDMKSDGKDSTGERQVLREKVESVKLSEREATPATPATPDQHMKVTVGYKSTSTTSLDDETVHEQLIQVIDRLPDSSHNVAFFLTEKSKEGKSTDENAEQRDVQNSQLDMSTHNEPASCVTLILP